MAMTEPVPERILALVPNWLGDVAMCTPALRALRRLYPDAEITAAGRAAACDLLAGLPWLTRLAPFPARAGFVDTIRIAYDLRPHARDLAVIFPHSFRAALLASLAGADRRVGYDRDKRATFLTDRVPPHTENGVIAPIYMAEEYLGLITHLGGVDDGKGLELRADPDVTLAVQARLAGSGPIVGIAPGAAFGPSKRWLPERYAAVADRLAEQAGARCVLITGPGEEDTRDAVMDAARTSFIRTDGGKPSIETLKATISQLDLLIGNDSGPRHVAVAFGTPVVCIMGSTSPRYSEGPYEKGRVLRVDVDCGPCQKPVCTTDHRCMTRITAEQVVEAALEFLPR